MEAIGEARVEWMSSSDIQASDEEVFNYTTVLPIKGKVNPLNPCQLQLPTLRPNFFILMLSQPPTFSLASSTPASQSQPSTALLCPCLPSYLHSLMSKVNDRSNLSKLCIPFTKWIVTIGTLPPENMC